MPRYGRLGLPLYEAIYSMRAIRRMRPDPISDEDLEIILDAARQAPNGGNAQPWHFLVVRDQAKTGRTGRRSITKPGGPSAPTRASRDPIIPPSRIRSAVPPCASPTRLATSPS